MYFSKSETHQKKPKRKLSKFHKTATANIINSTADSLKNRFGIESIIESDDEAHNDEENVNLVVPYHNKKLKYKTNMVNDLLANLSVSLADKERLACVNAELRKQVETLKAENETLANMIKNNKDLYQESLQNLQKEVSRNEKIIIDRSKEVLLRQKRYVDNVIGKLNYENKVLKNNINKMEQQFKKKIKDFENRLYVQQLRKTQ